MTRRTSTRALAQDIYRESAEDDCARGTLAKETPHPNPPPQGGREQSVPWERENSALQPDLTARVRALYEGSAVPVREIAALAGVTERTIYKYAAKHDWKPRYRWTPDGSRPRRWRASARYAPAKGAGGRFIGRADKDKPFAVGLNATDPAAAARAAAECERAQTIAAAAEAQAAKAQHRDACQRAMDAVNRAAAELRQYREEKAAALREWKKRTRWHPGTKEMPPSREDALVERALQQSLEAALRRWESLQAAGADR